MNLTSDMLLKAEVVIASTLSVLHEGMLEVKYLLGAIVANPLHSVTTLVVRLPSKVARNLLI